MNVFIFQSVHPLFIIDKEKVTSSKIRFALNSKHEHRNKKVLCSTIAEYDWEKLCFICSTEKNAEIRHSLAVYLSVMSSLNNFETAKNSI